MTRDVFGLKHFGANHGLGYQGWGFGGSFVSMFGVALMLSFKAPSRRDSAA